MCVQTTAGKWFISVILNFHCLYVVRGPQSVIFITAEKKVACISLLNVVAQFVFLVQLVGTEH